MKKTKWPGNWKVACHVCGWWYPSSEIKRRWDGVLVCPNDYETRHPQTLIRINGEKAVPTFVSKDASPDTFAVFCSLEAQSCYSGLATSGCARSGNQQYTFSFLHDLTTNGHNIK